MTQNRAATASCQKRRRTRCSEHWERAFSSRIKQSFGLQLLLQRFEPCLEKTSATSLQDLNIQLVLAACFENRNTAVDLDLGAIGNGLGRWRESVAKDYARDGGSVIFQGEVLMAGGMELVVRDFSLNPNRAEPGFQRSADVASQFADGEDLRSRLEEIGR